MKKILVALLVLATVLPAGAVLKEGNMEQTLGVLCEELSETHKEHKERAERFEKRNKQFQRSIGRDLELCNNIELMLYSQKEQNIFDLAYACARTRYPCSSSSRRMAEIAVTPSLQMDASPCVV